MKQYFRLLRSRTEARGAIRVPRERRCISRGMCWAYKQFAIFLFMAFISFYAVPFCRLNLAHSAEIPAMPGGTAIDRAMQKQRAMSDAIMQQADGRMQANQSHPAALPMPPTVNRSATDPQVIAQRFKLAREQKSARAASSDLLAFVSFSMPPASLMRLAREASKTGAVLVFRGLKDGSLKATVAAFKPYAQMGTRAQIDPVAFARYRVASVPRYVLNAGSDSACSKEQLQCAPKALTLAGDVSLDYALERMAASHDALAGRADQYLARLRGLR